MRLRWEALEAASFGLFACALIGILSASWVFNAVSETAYRNGIRADTDPKYHESLLADVWPAVALVVGVIACVTLGVQFLIAARRSRSLSASARLPPASDEN
ncbi:MAG TPA: hypothetical protein VK139_04680 [Microbacteriaceae bacterium]|nr:hypothetical protein [Microbacteriaceae bacterium]